MNFSFAPSTTILSKLVLDSRHPIFDAISKSAEDDVDAVRKYIDMKASEGGVDSIDFQDDSGMTLLMHAAWKGKLKVGILIYRPNLGDKFSLHIFS